MPNLTVVVVVLNITRCVSVNLDVADLKKTKKPKTPHGKNVKKNPPSHETVFWTIWKQKNPGGNRWEAGRSLLKPSGKYVTLEILGKLWNRGIDARSGDGRWQPVAVEVKPAKIQNFHQHASWNDLMPEEETLFFHCINVTQWKNSLILLLYFIKV